MKRVLVCGGAGFLGHHLCRRLLEAGHRVICVDDLSTGSAAKVEGLAAAYAGFRFVRQDIGERLEVDEPVDEVYNLACPASPVRYQLDPIATIRTNVAGMFHVLEVASRAGAKVLQASTSEVYGDPSVSPQREDYLGNVHTMGPRACYDEGKRMAETLCYEYRTQRSLDAKVVRIFNTYGPGMLADDGRVVSNFISQALHGDPLTVHGDGLQTRSLCYVDDLIEGLVRMMATPSGCAGPVNLGNPDERTVISIAEAVVALTGSRSAVVHLAPQEHDPKTRCPDISLAHELLGWRPEVSFEEGMARTVAYFARLEGDGS